MPVNYSNIINKDYYVDNNHCFTVLFTLYFDFLYISDRAFQVIQAVFEFVI